jgi:hypothetical protein
MVAAASAEKGLADHYLQREQTIDGLVSGAHPMTAGVQSSI